MQSFAFEPWGAPEEAGVSTRGILRFLDAFEQSRRRIQFHSLILLRHGRIVWRMSPAPYRADVPHTLYSLSKSFTSAAAGFAVSEGLLRWEDSVVDILPEEVPKGREEELRPITLEALLCMGSGLDKASDTPSPSPAISWARHVLSHEVRYPVMTHFSYNSFGTYLVSCMVQKVAGQTVRDYLIPRLFEPLGIEPPAWDQSPEGISCGGFGLHLSTEEIARFGQLLLEKGMWRGHRVLPEGWVELATRKHIENDNGTPQPENDWAQGYGFQFWRCVGGRYRGDGAMGQACFVDDRLDMVCAVTCGTNDLAEEFRMIREHLFAAPDLPPGTPEDRAELRRRTEALRYVGPADDGRDGEWPEGAFETSFMGQKMFLSVERAEEEKLRLTVSFEQGGGFTLALPRGDLGPAGEQPWQQTTLHFVGAYGWQEGKLQVSIHCLNGPETMEGFFRREGEKLIFEGVGVNFPDGGTEFVPHHGSAE